jgi:hypothetical protein
MSALSLKLPRTAPYKPLIRLEKDEVVYPATATVGQRPAG